jgi:hypothetical protein
MLRMSPFHSVVVAVISRNWLSAGQFQGYESKFNTGALELKRSFFLKAGPTCTRDAGASDRKAMLA